MDEIKTPTPQQVLDLPLPANDSGADTVRGYLIALAAEVWEHGECFSGKRPFGNSSWEYDLYVPLAKAGWVEATFDSYGDLDRFDRAAAHQMVADAIRALAVSA